MEAFAQKISRAFKRVTTCLFPTKKDTVLQIIVKMLYLVLILAIAISVCFVADYFTVGATQRRIVSQSRKLWYNSDKTYGARVEEQMAVNADYVGWLQVGNLVDNPVYQAADNKFYRTHNSLCEESDYGALYFDCTDETSGNDKNITIYGNNVKDGSMFGSLSRLRNVSTFSSNGFISLSTLEKSEHYAIVSVMLVTSDAEDDNGAPFDWRRTEFPSIYEFGLWRDEALARSIIYTGVGLDFSDKILTLVTDADDFDGAKLVVMAKKLDNNENASIKSDKIRKNQDVRYPKIWYDKRKLDYPF